LNLHALLECLIGLEGMGRYALSVATPGDERLPGIWNKSLR